MTNSSSPRHDFPEAPKPGLPVHSRALRRALLNAHERERSRSRSGFAFIFPMKQFAPVAVVGLALVVAGASFMPQVLFTTPVASAQELVNRAAVKVVSLPDDLRLEIEKRTNADLNATLEEAKAAPDLRILTPKEFQDEQKTQQDMAFKKAQDAGPKEFKLFENHPVAVYHITSPDGVPAQDIGFGTASATGEVRIMNVESGTVKMTAGAQVDFKDFKGGETASLDATTSGVKFTMAPIQLKEPVKYLAYTDKEGRKVILGLDEDDIVVMKMITMTMKMGDGSDASVMMGTMRGFSTADIKKK